MKKFISSGIFTMVTVFASLGLASQAFAYNTINSQLDFGDNNQSVANLQAFFKDNSAIYPEGLVTGYFGGLTQSAVKRFQSQYNFEQVGRVGPLTRDKINALIGQGGWVMADNSGPAFYSVTKNIATNSATFTWDTNENATAKIFYNTSPIAMNEGDINSNGFGSINGYIASNDNALRTRQEVTLSNLQPNTTYYYVVVSTDSAGNVSVWNPNTTFKTNQ